MKAKFSIIGFTAILFTTAWTAPSPVNGSADVVSVATSQVPGDGFSYVRTHRQGRGITTSWSFSSEGTVGFQLQKTYEDPNDEYAVWEDVSSVPCNGARSYKFTDTNVFPGNINYRVVALMADGSSVSSGVAAARIVSH